MFLRSGKARGGGRGGGKRVLER
eukprot:SAG11_NODE_15965_length_561_cov_0.794372_1_plen_22_part_10